MKQVSGRRLDAEAILMATMHDAAILVPPICFSEWMVWIEEPKNVGAGIVEGEGPPRNLLTVRTPSVDGGV